ncbi:type II toxin-antitoxin system prevent-host-death family antitoxin [uncultured Brevundimonas sp.]|uniref:type II toxin-antitoxin system prevent-host-death family antitoxin n=1 Tax=uncultured Brevundimonas sp. TaxID=213418 RepID=UPI002616AFE5|nr:type II toxin-antitoxin system prevent-host-death family antitoxin [uncultured Brevundimonas sp.]
MTTIPISGDKVSLTDLVRRVEAGEDVVLSHGGRPVARVNSLVMGDLALKRARAIEAAHVALQGVVFDETCAARSQDFLYDEDGLPA